MTEDTDVLGKGRWQLEFHGERAREDASTRRTEAAAVISHGVTDSADLQLEMPYVRFAREEGSASGAGDATLSLKWRVLDGERFRLLVRPDLIAPTGKHEDGLGAGRWRWAANLVAAYDVDRIEFLGHAGYTDNSNRLGERRSLWHLSGAALWRATQALTLLVDYAHDTNPDPEQGTAARQIVYGLLYAWTKDVDFGLGLQRGLTDAADERSVRAGIKLRW